MRHALAVAMLLTAGPIGLVHGADFYVATDGSDANPGTLEKPFATVAKAQEAVRGRIAAGLDSDLTVVIRGGVLSNRRAPRVRPARLGNERACGDVCGEPWREGRD